MIPSADDIVIAELVGLQPTGDGGQAQLFTVDSDGDFTQSGSSLPLSPATAMYSGFFGDQGYADLAAYLIDNAKLQFYAINGDNSFSLIGECTPAFSPVTYFLVGRFSPSSQYTDLVFFQQNSDAVHGQFFSTDGKGGLTAIGTGFDHPGYGLMPKSGHFDLNTELTDLFFFNPESCTIEFFTTDGVGNLVAIGTKQTVPGDGWTDVLVGNFGGTAGCSDLMFYNPTSGQVQFFSTPGDGTLSPIGDPADGMLSGGSLISGIFAGGTIFSDILVFNPSGQVQSFQTDGKGDIASVGGVQNWPSDTQFFPISQVR